MNVFYTLNIALRHSLMRRQFGDNPSQPETLLIDYPLHQH